VIFFIIDGAEKNVGSAGQSEQMGAVGQANFWELERLELNTIVQNIFESNNRSANCLFKNI